MKRQKLLNLLNEYFPSDRDEIRYLKLMEEFVMSNSECFDNYFPVGHITASSWIIDPERQMVGLVHHKKLNKWLQPGGHSDGNGDTSVTALREAREEFGIQDLVLPTEKIFDIDIHQIPNDRKRGLESHLHYDVRFLVYGDSNIKPIVSDESNEAIWTPIGLVHTLNKERSIMRLVEKTK
jgi:8-oxo-dGTP pyrophosphatase MutT (NUDIX family)